MGPLRRVVMRILLVGVFVQNHCTAHALPPDRAGKEGALCVRICGGRACRGCRPRCAGHHWRL